MALEVISEAAATYCYRCPFGPILQRKGVLFPEERVSTRLFVADLERLDRAIEAERGVV